MVLDYCFRGWSADCNMSVNETFAQAHPEADEILQEIYAQGPTFIVNYELHYFPSYLFVSHRGICYEINHALNIEREIERIRRCEASQYSS